MENVLTELHDWMIDEKTEYLFGEDKLKHRYKYIRLKRVFDRVQERQKQCVR